MLDAWSFQRVHEVYHPRRFASSAYRKLLGQSFNMQMHGDTVPVYKAVVSALSRSVNTLTSGSHLLHQLTPAVGVIAFALWGLGPLVHFVHHMFFHCNENSWRKCKTNYVLNSYLQPLMLWTGATFLCRVLDPVILPTEASQVVKQRILNFVKSLSTVLAFAYCLSSLIRQTQSFFMETNGSDDARNMGFQFAGKAVYSAVWVAAVSLFMELLGFSTQKWLTAGGLGTVLLTLAGREIFTNFLSSAMIHATRPFVLNEWIQTKIEGYEVSGTVEHVGWWSPTIIRGEDREALHIPNHKFTVNVVRNLSQKTHWRIKTHLAISHMDVNKINSIVADMRKVLAKNPQVEHKRLHRRVFLENIDRENQALLILISCFVKTSHFEEYLCVKERVLLDLLRVIRHHRARLATPIRTVQKIYGDADIENIPFAETIFSRAEVNKNRPFLLIEPSSKVNSDDKSKSRSSRSNEENDIKRQNPESKPIPSDSPAQASAEIKQVNKKSKDSTIKADEPSAPTISLSSELAEVTTGVDSISNPKEGMKLGISAEKPVVPNTDKDKVDGPTTSDPLQGKVDGEAPVLSTPTPRSALEENLVLGVALDGSKRVLPIEEESVEQREEEGHNNPIMPNAAASDLREQGR